MNSPTDSISTAAHETADHIKAATAATASQAKDQALQMVDQGKEQAADRLGAYSEAVRHSAETLEKEDPNIAWLSHQAADRLQKVSNYIRGRSWDDLRQDARQLAGSHPVAFFGGLFLTGLVVGNVLKATPVRGTQDSEPKDPAPAPASDAQPALAQG